MRRTLGYSLLFSDFISKLDIKHRKESQWQMNLTNAFWKNIQVYYKETNPIFFKKKKKKGSWRSGLWLIIKLQTHVLRLFWDKLKLMKLQRLLTHWQTPPIHFWGRTHTHTHTSSHTRSHTNTTEFLPCRAFCHWRQTALHRGTRKKGLWLDIVENENPSR